MTKSAAQQSDIFLFTEITPDGFDQPEAFRSECPPDKKVKVENLFKFSRTRGDLQVSIVAALIALFFLLMF